MTVGDVPAHLRRWRLVLGSHGESSTGGLSAIDRRRDRALEYLYDREYAARGVRVTRDGDGLRLPGVGRLRITERGGEPGGGGTTGGRRSGLIVALDWLGEVRRLFPVSVYETIQAHALARYGLTEFLTDPLAVAALEPNLDALRALMQLRGRVTPAVADAVREVVRQVVDQIVRRLRPRVLQAFSGRVNRTRRGAARTLANFDWRGTVRENLKGYDPDRRRIVVDRLRFFGRQRRHLAWTVVLCVDESGSMTDSVIHATVMAAILATLPSVRVRLVLFNTSVVDLTGRIADPVDILLSARLGGGTDIGRAVRYCEQLVSEPTRTIIVLISDFFEGAPAAPLIAAIRRLAEARVTLLGLIALADGNPPLYDRELASTLAACGMEIAALTPDRFADWLSETID